MSRIASLEPVFVEFIPPESQLEPGKLYVSMQYATTVHLCASGCGLKVVLPLLPAKWKLQFDGEAVSLTPSVGNWDHPCRSHYWIRSNKIEWAAMWDNARIEAGRKSDAEEVDDHYMKRPTQSPRRGFWSRLFGRN